MRTLNNLSIKTILIAAVLSFVLMLALVGAIGVWAGKSEHATDLKAVADRTSEAVVARMIGLMESNRSQVMLAMQHNPNYEFASQHTHPTSLHTDAIRQTSEKLAALWKTFQAGISNDEARALADALYADSGNLGLTAIGVFRVGDRCAGKGQTGESFKRTANPPARLAARPAARPPVPRESKPRKLAAAGGGAEEWEEF